MLLKNDLRGLNEQLRFKRWVAHATSIQTTICPDSIVARPVFVAEFFNSIDPKPSSSRAGLRGLDECLWEGGREEIPLDSWASFGSRMARP